MTAPTWNGWLSECRMAVPDASPSVGKIVLIPRAFSGRLAPGPMKALTMSITRGWLIISTIGGAKPPVWYSGSPCTAPSSTQCP